MLQVRSKVKQFAKFQHRSCIHHVVTVCKYVFAIRFLLYIAQNRFFGVLTVKMGKYCVVTPKGTTICEYASFGVSHVKIGSTA